MAVAAFSEVWRDGGVGPWEGSMFMALSQKKANLVLLSGASPRDLKYDRQRLLVREVTKANLLDIAKEVHEEVKPKLSETFKSLKSGSHLLAIRGLKGSESSIKAGEGMAGTLKTGLFPPRTYSVAFKFLRHDEKSQATKWKPTHAKGWLVSLNAIYRPQANIAFEMAEEPDYVMVPTALGQPINDKAFFAHVVGKKSKKANLTIFLVGKWKGDGGHPNGTTFHQENVSVLDDEPQHPKLAPDIDPLVQTLAHEVGHFILYGRGFKNSDHHNSRDRILLSSGIQSTRIDKQLMLHLNTYG